MKNIYNACFIVLITLVISCKEETKNNSDTETKTEEIPEPIIEKYGFTYNHFQVVEDTIKSGDTFGTIMQNYILPDSIGVHTFAEKVKDSFNVRKIKAGNPYTLLLDKADPKKIKAFIYIHDRISYTVIDLRDSVVVFNRHKPTSIKRRIVAAEIEGSLSETLNKAGIGSGLASKLASVYAYSIDFFKIQKGDRFAVSLYEKYIEDTIYAGIVKVDATYFKHKGKEFYAFPYSLNGSKGENYYDEQAKALKSMFLKAPLDYFRISSKFSPRRFHPVQQTWKAHNGTDYAAAHGTPIKVTASGVVEAASYTSGNGNFVKVRHNSTYSTQYLHMSKILVRKGQHVSQGQVIGKVGSTGLATGPHVCYRFWKNGVQVDPLRQKLPNTTPIEGAQREVFLQHIKPLKTELDSIIKVTFATREE